MILDPDAGAHDASAVAEGFGNCRMTVWTDPINPPGRLRIDQADPKILIVVEVLNDIAHGKSPWASVDSDGVIRIKADNRTVIYKLGPWRPEFYAFEAQFPD